MVAPYVAVHLDTKDGLDIIKDTPFEKTAWQLQDRLYVPLRRMPKEAAGFIFPDCFPREKIRLHIAERYRKDGGATVVCGLKGGKLRPHFLYKSPLPDYLTCWFSAINTAYTVTAWYEERKIIIKRRSLVIEDRSVFISDLLESRHEFGFGDALPSDLECFRDAINAAIAKSQYPKYRMSYFFNPCGKEPGLTV